MRKKQKKNCTKKLHEIKREKKNEKKKLILIVAIATSFSPDDCILDLEQRQRGESESQCGQNISKVAS